MEAGLLPDSDSQKKAQTRGCFFNLDTKVYPKHEKNNFWRQTYQLTCKNNVSTLDRS